MLESMASNSTGDVFLVMNEYGERLCQDGRMRDFACFGTERTCVKVYKVRGRALNAAEESAELNVVFIPEDAVMDASGRLTRTTPVPDKPGYERVEELDWTDYIV